MDGSDRLNARLSNDINIMLGTHPKGRYSASIDKYMVPHLSMFKYNNYSSLHCQQLATVVNFEKD